MLGLIGLGACGGSSDEGTASDTPAADAPGDEPSGGEATTGDTVVIEGFKFSPTPLTVKVGTTITVENKDGATHTLTADDDDSLDTGDLKGGESGSITVRTAGDIAYHCELHDYMKGVIRVEA